MARDFQQTKVKRHLRSGSFTCIEIMQNKVSNSLVDKQWVKRMGETPSC